MGKIITHKTEDLFNFTGSINSITRTNENGDCYIATYVSTQIIYLYKYNIFSNVTTLIATLDYVENFKIQYSNNKIYIVYREPYQYSYKYRVYYIVYNIETSEFSEPILIYDNDYSIAETYPAGIGNISISEDGSKITIGYFSISKSGITKYYRPFIIEYDIENNILNTFNPNNSYSSNYSNSLYAFFSNENGSAYWDGDYCSIFSSPNEVISRQADREFNAIFIPNTNYYISRNSYGILNEDFSNTKIADVKSEYIPCILNDNYMVTIDRANHKYNIFILEDYDLTYTFKTNSEDVVLTNKTPITSIDISYQNNIVGVKLTFLDGTVEGISYTIFAPTDKIFSGLSLNPNALTPYLPIGKTNIELNKSLIFYPVFTQYRPLTKNFNIIFYNNISEPNRVDKTNYLTKNTEVIGVFRTETSITNITLTIEQEDFPLFNYAYIPIFNRYYFITDITSLRYGLWEISLQIDVLMTYKNAIKSCNCFCDRNEFLYNDNIIDKKRVIEQGYDVETIPIQNDLFVDGNGSLVIQGFNLGTWNE